MIYDDTKASVDFTMACMAIKVANIKRPRRIYTYDVAVPFLIMKHHHGMPAPICKIIAQYYTPLAAYVSIEHYKGGTTARINHYSRQLDPFYHAAYEPSREMLRRMRNRAERLYNLHLTDWKPHRMANFIF